MPNLEDDVAIQLNAALKELTGAGLLSEAQAKAMHDFIETNQLPGYKADHPGGARQALLTMGAIAVVHGYKT